MNIEQFNAEQLFKKYMEDFSNEVDDNLDIYIDESRSKAIDIQTKDICEEYGITDPVMVDAIREEVIAYFAGGGADE